MTNCGNPCGEKPSSEMGGVRRGRECKRFKERAAAEYALKHDLCAREAPDAATVASLVDAIDKRNSGAFGLARLARLDLDVRIRCPLVCSAQLA